MDSVPRSLVTSSTEPIVRKEAEDGYMCAALLSDRHVHSLVNRIRTDLNLYVSPKMTFLNS
jgi:hypothetical protein